MNGIHPFRVLRARPLWIASGVITGVLALLFSIFYVGPNIDPAGHAKNLPVGLVNSDKGASVGGKQDQSRGADHRVDQDVHRGRRQDRLEGDG